MLRIFVVALFVFVTFLIEGILSDLFGRWFSPNLLIILVIFFTLSRGIRYGLVAALLAGLLKDSFSVKVFGLNIFSFITCAYLTIFIKRYIYQTGSNASRILMVFLISLIYVGIQYMLHVMFTCARQGIPPLSGLASIDFAEMFAYILLPEVLATTLVTVFVFERLKQCALRLFV